MLLAGVVQDIVNHCGDDLSLELEKPAGPSEVEKRSRRVLQGLGEMLVRARRQAMGGYMLVNHQAGMV